MTEQQSSYNKSPQIKLAIAIMGKKNIQANQ